MYNIRVSYLRLLKLSLVVDLSIRLNCCRGCLVELISSV